MKAHHRLAAIRPFLLICLAGFLLAGCISLRNPFAPAPDLTGTWRNRHQTVWTLRSDGTFQMNHGGHFITTGTYSTSKDNKLTLMYTGGKIPWDGHEPATYRVIKEEKSFRLILQHDTCTVRIVDLPGKWKKFKP